MQLLQRLKLGTSCRNLLFIAALVWTFAGGMLLTKGIVMMGILLFASAFRFYFSGIYYRLVMVKMNKEG